MIINQLSQQEVSPDETDTAIELIKKIQSSLEDLHSKFLVVKKIKNDLKEENQTLSDQAGELSEARKKLEASNMKLTQEVLSLRAEDKKTHELRRLNAKLRKALNIKTSEFEVSINQHARTKVENEDIRKSNAKLSEEIAALHLQLRAPSVCVKLEHSTRGSRNYTDKTDSRKRFPLYRKFSISLSRGYLSNRIRSRSPRGRKSRSRSLQMRSRTRSRPRYSPRRMIGSFRKRLKGSSFKRGNMRSPLRRNPVRRRR